MAMNPEPTAPTTDAPTYAPPVAAPMGSGTMSAQPVAGAGTRRVGKTRSPITVWLLTLITFGIYGLYWYYKVNAEVKEYDPSIEVSPGIALLAMFVPIVNWVSIFNTGGRIAQAQQRAGRPERCSGILGLLLTFVFGTWVIYYQAQLNTVWESHGSPQEGTLV